MLGMLVAAYVLFRRKEYVRHAHFMPLAFGINIASYLLVMIPSLAMSASTFFVPPIVIFDVVSVVHIPTGAIAMLLSAFLVFRWASHSYATSGCKGKLLMRSTMITWSASILIGTSIYFMITS